MKIKSKYILSLILVLLCFASTACSRSDDKKIIGSWETDIDLTKSMSDNDPDGTIQKYFSDGLNMTFTFTFDVQKKVSLNITEDSIKNFKSTVKTGMKNMLIDTLGGTDEAEEYAVSTMGYGNLDECSEALSDSFVNADDLMGQASLSGNFELADGKLFIYDDARDENEYFKYEFVSDTELNFTEYVSKTSSKFPFEMPIKLHKN